MAHLASRLIAVYSYSVPELANHASSLCRVPHGPHPLSHSPHHPLPLQYAVMSLAHTKDEAQLPTSTILLSISWGRITIRGCWRTMT